MTTSQIQWWVRPMKTVKILCAVLSALILLLAGFVIAMRFVAPRPVLADLGVTCAVDKAGEWNVCVCTEPPK